MRSHTQRAGQAARGRLAIEELETRIQPMTADEGSVLCRDRYPNGNALFNGAAGDDTIIVGSGGKLPLNGVDARFLVEGKFCHVEVNDDLSGKNSFRLAVDTPMLTVNGQLDVRSGGGGFRDHYSFNVCGGIDPVVGEHNIGTRTFVIAACGSDGIHTGDVISAPDNEDVTSEETLDRSVTYVELGRALKVARYHAGVSQSKLAIAVSNVFRELGIREKTVTQSFICRVEKSRGNFSVATLEVMCGCLGYTVAQVWEIAEYLAKNKGKSEDQLLDDLQSALRKEFAELRKERDLVKDVKVASGVGGKVANPRRPSVK